MAKAGTTGPSLDLLPQHKVGNQPDGLLSGESFCLLELTLLLPGVQECFWSTSRSPSSLWEGNRMAVSTLPSQAKGVPEKLSPLSNLPALPQGFLLSSPGSILFSWGCRNKLPQTEWLKTTEITLSQFWRLEDCGRATVPPKALGKHSSWPFPASTGPRCSLSASVFMWSFLCVSVCPLLLRTLTGQWILGPT